MVGCCIQYARAVMNAEIDRSRLVRVFAGFIGFEAMFGFAIMLTHWVTIFPAYLKSAGAPLTVTALVAQGPHFLAMISMVFTLKYLAWRPKRRNISMVLILMSSLLLLPLAAIANWGITGTAMVVWGSLALILLRFVVISTGGPLHYGLMMEVTPLAYRGRLMGARLLAIGGMGFIGAYTAKRLLSSGGLPAYGRCFVVAAAAYTVALVFYLLIKEEPRPNADRDRKANMKVLGQLKHLLSKSMFRRWIGAHLCFIGALGASGLLTIHYQETFGGGDEVIGNLSMVFACAILVAGPCFGFVTDKLGSRFTSLMFFCAYAAAFGLSAAIGTRAMAYPTFALLGVGHSLSEMWFANYQAELFPDENRVGFLASFRILSAPVALVSAVVFGQMCELGVSYHVVFAIAAGLACLGFLVVRLGLPDPRKK